LKSLEKLLRELEQVGELAKWITRPCWLEEFPRRMCKLSKRNRAQTWRRLPSWKELERTTAWRLVEEKWPSVELCKTVFRVEALEERVKERCQLGNREVPWKRKKSNQSLLKVGLSKCCVGLKVSTRSNKRVKVILKVLAWWKE
jgi:hypothetical protein